MTLRKAILSLFAYSFISTSSRIISTKTGDIAGKTENIYGRQIETYLGIPYAIPPLGELRFKQPVPIKPWRGIRNTTREPPSCMQILCLALRCSENCLFLNIWVPKNGSDSVMVWIYGGGFLVGSISQETYDGGIMASLGDVIVVSINYRVGPFGFLFSDSDDAPGNMGIKDQVLGLRWIKDNIKAFGGDPSKITMFGESAGAVSVLSHVVSPLTKNLFKSAILQSGLYFFPTDVAIRHPSLIKLRSNKLALMTGCALLNQDIASDPKVMRCLRKLSPVSILVAEIAVIISILMDNKIRPDYIFFSPIYGDDYLPNPPKQEFDAGNYEVEHFMIGTVRDEGSAFILWAAPLLILADRPIIAKIQFASYIKTLFRGISNPTSNTIIDYYLTNASFFDDTLVKRAYETIGDSMFVCQSVSMSKSISSHGRDVYHYTFSHRWSRSPAKKWMGVIHTEELKFLFGSPLRSENFNKFTLEEKEFSKELIYAWTSFAKEGKPIYRRLSDEWPSFKDKELAVDLNPYNASLKSPYKEACNFWKKFS